MLANGDDACDAGFASVAFSGAHWRWALHGISRKVDLLAFGGWAHAMGFFEKKPLAISRSRAAPPAPAPACGRVVRAVGQRALDGDIRQHALSSIRSP